MKVLARVVAGPRINFGISGGQFRAQQWLGIGNVAREGVVEFRQ
jgi:hypothetical protein